MKIPADAVDDGGDDCVVTVIVPTMKQVATVVHATPDRPVTVPPAGSPDGATWLVHSNPPFTVPRDTYPPPAANVAVATQSEPEKHPIALTAATDAGMVCAIQFRPPSVVASMTPCPLLAALDPTAKQVAAAGQAMAEKSYTPAGTASPVHPTPPSVVP